MKSDLSMKEIEDTGIFKNIPNNVDQNLNLINHNIESYFFAITKDETLSDSIKELSKQLSGIMSMYIDCSKKRTIFMPMLVFADGRRTFAMDDLSEELSEELFNILESDLCDNLFVKSRVYDAIWVKRSIKNPFDSGQKAMRNYEQILELCIKNNDFYLAGEILQRCNCLVLELGSKFSGRQNYIDKLKKLTNLTISEDNLYFLSRIWDSVLEIGGDEVGLREKVAKDIELYLFNTSDKTNGGFEEHISDVLCKYYRVLKDTVSERKVLEWQAEQLSRQAENTEDSYKQIHLLSKSIECYRRIIGNPCKTKIENLYSKIRQAQNNLNPLGIVKGIDIDISLLVKPTIETFSDKGFPTCIMGLWHMKYNFISMEKSKTRDGKYSPLLDLIPISYWNHRGRPVAITTGQHQIGLSRSISRGLFVNGYLNPLMDIIKNDFSFNHTAFIDFVTFNAFVPKGYEQMFTKGFDYFFKGMLLEAATILIPLLENSLRYIVEDKHPMIFKKADSEVFHERVDIAEIIAKVKEEKLFDDIILSHIEELMIGPNINIRNNIAHGMYSNGYFYTDEVKILLYFIFVLVTDGFFKGILQESERNTN